MASESTPKSVIFDTDMGGDDAWALQMLLKAEKVLGNVKLLAITTIAGNTSVDNVIKNTYRILDGLNRTDIPIYKGAAEGIIPYVRKEAPFWGANGFSDVEFWQPHYPSEIDAIVKTKNAVEIIRDLILENPHQITLITVGPLTNIALAIKTFPEIKDKIKEIYIMGGNHRGRGNIVLGAEFNFHADANAAHIVLNSLKCPIKIVTLECGTDEGLRISKEWRFNVLGNVDDRNIQLLNEVERIAFQDRKFYTPFDAILTAVFLFPDKCIETMNRYHATVELDGVYTRGQMVFDRRSDNFNVTVIETVDEEEFKKTLLWSASA